MNDLSTKRCKACEGGVNPLDLETTTSLLKSINSNWQLDNSNKKITRTCEFNNYYEVMAFVNAIAWMTHYQNHHPDLEVSYNQCKISYTTHAIDGLSENDFICAANVDQIYASGT